VDVGLWAASHTEGVLHIPITSLVGTDGPNSSCLGVQRSFNKVAPRSKRQNGYPREHGMEFLGGILSIGSRRGNDSG